MGFLILSFSGKIGYEGAVEKRIIDFWKRVKELRCLIPVSWRSHVILAP